MARVTIEDCLEHVHSRFQLTMVAAKRARQLARGAESRLPWDGHKSTVLALREIADGRVTVDVLREADLPHVSATPRVPDVIDDYVL
ncbi:MAG: DNA-directed RNA polymerase subunit omega [Gammaproteobacteria bacterium]